MTVYGEYDATMSDSELLAFLVDGKIGYREYAGREMMLQLRIFLTSHQTDLKQLAPSMTKEITAAYISISPLSKRISRCQASKVSRAI